MQKLFVWLVHEIGISEMLDSTDHKNASRIIAIHLKDSDGVIRCEAARALGNTGGDVAAKALVDLLLDEDPDVRSDAMTALVNCARPQDAPAILRSLLGDHVKGVKIAAISALAKLKDPEALVLFLRLALNRLDDEVNWGNTTGAWDDWLDVQVSVIEALSQFGGASVVAVLNQARRDEYGQDLDHIVFAAFAQIPDGGVAALLEALRDTNPKTRARALIALTRVRPKLLAPMMDLFVTDSDPRVRILVMDCDDAAGKFAEQLAFDDSDVGVRVKAVTTFGATHPDLALLALKDEDETVRAAALDHISSNENDDLIANIITWADHADAPLGLAAIKALPRLSPETAIAPLATLAANAERPTEIRIAAINALGDLGSEAALERLKYLVTDPVKPVRMAALINLVKLVEYSKREEERSSASTIVIKAMRGELSANCEKPEEQFPKDDLTVSSSMQVRITPDGELIQTEETAPDETSQSTLSALLTEAETQKTAASIKPSVRHRARIDGPSTFGEDLRISAIRIGANLSVADVTSALSDAINSESGVIQRTGFEAICLRAIAGTLSLDHLEAAKAAISSTDTETRLFAARILRAGTADANNLLDSLQDDSNASIRAEVLRATGQENTELRLKYLNDDSSVIRDLAIQMILEVGNNLEVKQAIEICTRDGNPNRMPIDLLQSPAFSEHILSELNSEQTTKPRIHVLLSVISSG